MRFRQLGSSGLTVSVVGLGGNNFGTRCGQEQTTSVVHAALDAGVTFIDTAPAYGGPDGSELMLGNALKGRRQNVVLATKFGFRILRRILRPVRGATSDAKSRTACGDCRRTTWTCTTCTTSTRSTPIDETLGL